MNDCKWGMYNGIEVIEITTEKIITGLQKGFPKWKHH